MLVALRRDGLDPELAGAADPITKVILPLGIRGWLVTGYDEVRQVLADHDSFSNDFGNLVGRAGVAAGLDPGGLGFTDPPYHTRMRHMLTRHFTTRRLAALAPRVSAIVESSLADVERELDAFGRTDLVERFAIPVPTLTICELLGVPYADREHFQQLSSARFDLTGGASASLDAVNESLTYLEDLVARRRREPDDGLLAGLVADHGSQFSDRELAGVADGLLTGGIETTVSTLGLGSLVLLQDPVSFARLAQDEVFAAAYVEELLRYLTVVQVAFPRFARRDVDVGASLVRRHDVVLCSLSAAGRDPRTGEHLNEVDPEAARRPHLAFGHGIHRCVGAELARLELRLAFPALSRRLPDLRLAVDTSELEYRALSIVFGLPSLPVTCSR
ncbi:MAG TPA: cytochrome P450 [Nocardioidaceae bacterium]